MTIKIAINGFGRIGRNIVRAVYEKNMTKDIQIVAINDLTDIETAKMLLKYDTVHGKFGAEVSIDGDYLVVNGNKMLYTNVKNPAELPWKDFGIDVVHECTGKFNSMEKASAYLQAGAKKVLISSPASGAVSRTVVYGVNHHELRSTDTIVSNASCTTNALAPMVKALSSLGLVKGLMLTCHSYTNDQVLIDGPHKDIRRARAACVSMIPTKTGAAAAVGEVLPELKGRLDGYAIRVPTINVSLVDLTFEAKINTTDKEVNQLVKTAAEGELKGILGYTEEKLVSTDYNHNELSSIFDATLTKVIGGNLVKVSAWYDNEWGFSNRMIDTTIALMNAK